jgi:hypothetical protein
MGRRFRAGKYSPKPGVLGGRRVKGATGVGLDRRQGGRTGSVQDESSRWVGCEQFAQAARCSAERFQGK